MARSRKGNASGNSPYRLAHEDTSMLQMRSYLALLPLLSLSVTTAAPATQQVLQSYSFINTLTRPDDIRLAQHIDSLPEPRLVRFALEDGTIQQETISEGEKALLVYNGIKFEDATDEVPSLHSYAGPGTFPLACEIEFQLMCRDRYLATFPETWTYGVKELAPLYKNISTARMTDALAHFTSFRTRY